MVLEKGERETKNIKKKTVFFFCKKRAALYSVAITAFLSNTLARTQLHFTVVDQ